MGTRCNVVINYEETKINLYRHWDGYYSETGYDLAVRLNHSLIRLKTQTLKSFLIVYSMHKEASAFTIWTRSNTSLQRVNMETLFIFMSSLSIVKPKVVESRFWIGRRSSDTGYEVTITKENIGSLIDWVLQENTDTSACEQNSNIGGREDRT